METYTINEGLFRLSIYFDHPSSSSTIVTLSPRLTAVRDLCIDSMPMPYFHTCFRWCIYHYFLFLSFLFLVFTFYRVGMQHADGIYFFKASWKTSSNRKLDCMLLAVAIFMRPQYVWSLNRDRQILLRKYTDLKKRPISNHGYRDYMNAAKCRMSWSLPIGVYIIH